MTLTVESAFVESDSGQFVFSIKARAADECSIVINMVVISEKPISSTASLTTIKVTRRQSMK